MAASEVHWDTRLRPRCPVVVRNDPYQCVWYQI